MKLGMLVVGLSVALVADAAGPDTMESLARQVRAAETAFARSMADRDLEAFAALVAEDAVFFDRDGVLRGKAAVVAGWKPLFDGPKASFSWESAQVEVLDSGTLAHSSGPVRDPAGKQVGVFNSVWRREADGGWKVILDKGCDVCRCGET